MQFPPELVDLRQELRLAFRRVVEDEPGVVRRHDGEVGGDGEDVAHGPRLEEVERDVDMALQQRLERNQSLLNLLRRVPLGCLFGACVRPTLQELLHGIYALARFIVCNVDNIIEEELWDKAKELRKENRRNS